MTLFQRRRFSIVSALFVLFASAMLAQAPQPTSILIAVPAGDA